MKDCMTEGEGLTNQEITDVIGISLARSKSDSVAFGIGSRGNSATAVTSTGMNETSWPKSRGWESVFLGDWLLSVGSRQGGCDGRPLGHTSGHQLKRRAEYWPIIGWQIPLPPAGLAALGKTQRSSAPVLLPY